MLARYRLKKWQTLDQILTLQYIDIWVQSTKTSKSLPECSLASSLERNVIHPSSLVWAGKGALCGSGYGCCFNRKKRATIPKKMSVCPLMLHVGRSCVLPPREYTSAKLEKFSEDHEYKSFKSFWRKSRSWPSPFLSQTHLFLPSPCSHEHDDACLRMRLTFPLISVVVVCSMRRSHVLIEVGVLCQYILEKGLQSKLAVVDVVQHRCLLLRVKSIYGVDSLAAQCAQTEPQRLSVRSGPLPCLVSQKLCAGCLDCVSLLRLLCNEGRKSGLSHVLQQQWVMRNKINFLVYSWQVKEGTL